MTWTPHGPQGKEASKIRYNAWMYMHGLGVDIGCGDDLISPHSIGIDFANFGGVPYGTQISDGTKLEYKDESLNYVFSSHCLEHVEDYKAALREWWRVLKPNGNLILYLPHRDYYPQMGQSGANPDHKHDFHPNDIKQAMLEIADNAGLTVLEDQDRKDDNEYSFFQVFRKTPGVTIYKPWHVRVSEDKKSKTVCIFRPAAIGDMALVEPVVAEYHRRGWYVALCVNAESASLFAADPRVDEFILIHSKGAYVVGLMEPFWLALSQRFTNFINLVQSIEGTLLPGIDSIRFVLPEAARRVVCNVNYYEHTMALAGLMLEDTDPPMRPSSEFYWTKEEEARAWELTGRAPYIAVQLAGSAAHKIYQFWHIALPRLAYVSPATYRIVLLGGEEDKVAAVAVMQTAIGLGVDDCIIDLVGKCTVRESIVVAKHARVVVGPETGILNWVAYSDNWKVLMLSHSSVENLPKHWKNTVVLTANIKTVPCYPCHRKHNQDLAYCNKHPAGGSMCMAHSPEAVVKNILIAVKGAENAKQVKEASEDNASSSAQPEVREEGRNSSGNGAGVYPSGSEEISPAHSSEAENGKLLGPLW